MHILITDDENFIREGIKRTIGNAFPDYDVHLAASAEEAVELMSQHRMDIVLTDILMPGINGLELMKISRRKQPQAKWVVISAHSEFSYAQQAVHLGARDYLLKPIGKPKLVELIETLSEEIRQQQAHVQEEETLREGLQYLRSAAFQRLAAGLSVGKLSLEPLLEQYPEYYLLSVNLGDEQRSGPLEHFIVENVLTELIRAYGHGFVVSLDRSSLLSLVALKSNSTMEELQERVNEQLARCLKSQPFTSLHSGPHHGFEHIAEHANRLRRGQRPIMLTEQTEGSSGDTAIRMALQYIDAHFQEELSLEKVASVVFLNPVYFSQLFKQKTGQGYKEYVISLRMDQACELLMNPGLRLVDIAEQIGYASVRHFTQVFRKKYMLTPTEYRQQKHVLEH
ncbi:response regulator [Paenibacillus hunanensis]|uniref:response regulator n=1 Tax=Paenibacillus hunanensis TaxID=539262 RepID=UPI00202600B7|nr:response regulator [Paenibacillus hunanensis]MCL9660919.1 response regulator [Paenibacillus hunanensis]